MKRRGFFGFAAGAAVAGPGMVKQAAEQIGLDALRIGGGESNLIGMTGSGYGLQTADKAYDAISEAKGMLAKFVGITAAQRARAKRETHIGSLDPDLASYRSFSLSAKIEMQRERNVEARIHQSKSMWQRMADGISGEDDWLPM